jgi:hypothetical protein
VVQFFNWTATREALAVALFNAAHGSQQMVIYACSQLLMLAVKDLHHERTENADLLQCFHVAMNAGECCVKTVEEIVDLRFGYTAGFRHTAKIRGSHGSPFL